MRTVTLADFRPSRRADGTAWTQARLEVADSAEPKEWEAAETVDLEPVDEDPTSPALRSFTLQTDKAWARIVFLDAKGNEDMPSALIALTGSPFQPTVKQVSAILRARTYAEGSDPEGLTGGDLVGEFNAETRPSAEEVEQTLIPQACLDVARETGAVPGELLEDARRVAAIGAAREIERSYIPEQADETHTIFQTLRLTFDSELEALTRNLWLWTLANRGVV